MAGRTVTIKDVAVAAGVAESTVSRVLSGTETLIPISADTRQRVLKAARDLAYRANPGARLLRGKGVNLLGVIVSEIDDPFHAHLTDALGAAAANAGYDLLLGFARSDPAEARRLSEVLDPRFCDGLFLVGDLLETAEDLSFLEVVRGQMPLILVCRGHHELVGPYPSVGIDNHAAVRLALDHLWALGHRRIGFIGSGRLGDLWERRMAYIAYMADRGAPATPELIQPAVNSFEGGFAAMEALFALPEPPSAICTADDTMAIGALKAAHVRGVRVPEELSIVGFDNMDMARFVHPALTTINQSVAEIADAAVALFLKMIRGELALDDSSHIITQGQLVIRESTQACHLAHSTCR
jgi:DNA-binding LacI/PurR family transcriptional regulator